MSDMLFTMMLVSCVAMLCQGKETSRMHIINEERNWWEAQSRCKDNGGRLFTQGTDDIPAELWRRLDRLTLYWIGAMSYRAWRWTVDGSPLFTYAGFLPLESVAAESKETYLANSVWMCHLHCSQANSVGMKGTTCYCLGEGYNTSEARTPEDTCPGNLEERCGNMHGMSVYKLENMMFNQEEDTHCAYAEDTDLSIHTSTYADCKNIIDCYACFALSGASIDIYCTPKKSWFDAWDTCDLVKLNTSVRTSLLGSRRTTRTYWIGLHKYLQRKWINGKRALKYDGHLDASPSGTWCLAVYKNRFGGKRLYWRPCSDNIKSLCEDATTVTPQTTTTSTTVTPQSTPQPSPPATVSQSPGSVATIDNSADVEIAGRKDATKPYITPAVGGFVGLGVGCVLLVLTVLFVVYLLRRQKKKRDRDQPIHFTSAAENITYGLNNDSPTESEAYAVTTLPDATAETPASSTVPTAIVRPSIHNENIYINTSQINDENEYNVLSTSKTSKVPVSHGNPYNHLSGPDTGNKYNGDYDTTHFVAQTEATTGLKNTVTHPRLPDVSSCQVFEEEQYNVLGQHDSPRTDAAAAGVYGHLCAYEGDYDTARWGKSASEIDDSYSHIQKTSKPCQEDTYDVTSKRQSERRSDDTYNNVVKVEDGRGDTTHYLITRRLLESGNLEGHVEGDTESDRGGQENVYSLARDISDA